LPFEEQLLLAPSARPSLARLRAVFAVFVAVLEEAVSGAPALVRAGLEAWGLAPFAATGAWTLPAGLELRKLADLPGSIFRILQDEDL
ncbi:MAG: hypothetical protein HQK54_09675, partial [Oligoflexales bacterium]|nr:hypothetical protein [Oligoflexales bacterium]